MNNQKGFENVYYLYRKIVNQASCQSESDNVHAYVKRINEYEFTHSVFAGSYLRYKRASLISSDLAVLVKFFLLKNALIVPLKAVDFCA